MMKKITYLLIFVSTLLLSWLLPWAYSISKSQRVNYPFVHYSPIIRTYCYPLKKADAKVNYVDANGKEYSESQFYKMMPLFYYRQLVKDDCLPDSINGVAVTPKSIYTSNFYFRYKPSYKNSPKIKLYTLFESMSRKVDLELPGDMFRFTDKIEFIDPKTNKVKVEKSDLFMNAFNKRGFVPPAKMVEGNPSLKKPYDEGYLVVDSKNQIFHLKMVNGKPFVRNTNIDTSINPKYIATTEFPNKKTYAFLFSEDNQLYVISTHNYQLIKIPIPPFSPKNDELFIFGNMFYWNVKVTSATGMKAYAVETKTFQKVDSISFPNPNLNKKSYVKELFFPFTLSFTSKKHNYVKPHIEFGSGLFLIIGLLLAGIYLLLHRKKIDKYNWIPIVLWITLTGIYGFLSLWVIYSLKIRL